MKATARALTCLALALASFEAHVAAIKLVFDEANGNPLSALVTDVNVSITTAPWCTGNVFPFPDKEYTLQSSNAEVITEPDLTQLKSVLGQDSDWGFDRVWQFKAKVTSGFNISLKFFMGGDNGFINFVVPANAGAQTVEKSGKVRIDPTDVALTYDTEHSSTSALTAHKVVFSQLCLRQLPCSAYSGCLPNYRYKPNISANGDSFEDCCQPIFCKDTVNCTPATQYENFPDTETTRLGNTKDLCCNQRLCSEVSSQVCSESSAPKKGTGLLGSTAGECCERSYCRDFTGCDPTHDTSALPFNNDDGTPRVGSTEEECCNVIQCSTFNCSKSDLWTSKSNSSGKGHSFAQCCDPLYCANYTCVETNKYQPKSNPPVQGNSDERCCQPVYCSSYTCSNSSLAKMAGASNRFGSTDEDCCEEALCLNYECSDGTKWWPKTHMVEVDGTQGPRFGNTDEECCTPLYCKDFSCTSTRWKNKEVQNATELGWSHEQCCDPIYCENYNCTTDYDGDGNGTKWYKKADTNALKWQGSTDEECCYAMFCSQFLTEYPTQWKRKEGDTPILGSTELECYDPIFCSSFCDCNETEGQKLIADASGVQGSTAAECCENSTDEGSSSAASTAQSLAPR